MVFKILEEQNIPPNMHENTVKYPKIQQQETSFVFDMLKNKDKM